MKKIKLPTDIAAQNAYLMLGLILLLRPLPEILIHKRENTLETIIATLVFASVISIAAYFFSKKTTRQND